MITPWRRHRALALLVERWPELDGDEPPPRDVLAGLLARADLPWTLADQHEARARGYEACVVAGRIPTRDRSWHDVFNTLAFVGFARTKAAIHRRCFELQQRRDRASPRSREEDALTLIDETSLVLAGSAEAIAAFEHERLGRDLTALDRVVVEHGITAYVLGHALLEHLVLERPPIGAGVVTVALERGPGVERSFADVDRALAERVAAGGFPQPRLSPTLPWPNPVVDGWLHSPS